MNKMIHKFRFHETNVVVDVNSGAVHVFDDVAYDATDYCHSLDESVIVDMLCDKYDRLQIREAIQEIKVLEEKGLLFSSDDYETLLSNEKREKKYFEETDIPRLKALCLHVSHDCNMRCGYCFASTGNFGGERTVMSPEMGRKAVDFLVRESGKRRNLEIDFFGGEPLLNIETVKEVVDYGISMEEKHGKEFRFTLTTNALLLDDKSRKYINEHIHNIVLSIDGRRETHDRMRFRLDGSGTYDDVLPGIMDIADSRNHENYYVRGTFTRENLDFSLDVIHLADMGFRQISIEPVVAAGDTAYGIREEDLPVIFSEYERLACEYVKRIKSGNGFNFFHFMIDLEHGPCIAKRLNGCGSGYDYLAVTPGGDIYPCHQFVGIDEFKMGNVSSGVADRQIQNRFRRTDIYTKKECMLCWARFYCSGGCAANAYRFSGSIDLPYAIGCEMEKKRIECALWIKTQL